MAKGRRKKREFFGIPIPAFDDKCCCILILAMIVGGLLSVMYSPVEPLPDEGDDDNTNTTTTPPTTTTPDSGDTGTPEYLVKMCLQWTDTAAFKDALRFNVLATTGTDILDYVAFTEAMGDAVFTWYYGVLSHHFASGFSVRIKMIGDDHYSFESFSTVAYSSAGSWSNTFEIYYNPIAGQLLVGHLYVTWELI